MTHQEIIHRLVDEAWNAGDLRVIDECYDPSYVGHDAFEGDSDRERFKQSIRMYRAAFPDLKFKIDEIFSAGDNVVARITCSGTHKGMLGGLAPTGKKSSVRALLLAKVREGKIVESYAQWDTLKWLQDLGVVAPSENLLRGGKAAEARPS